MRASFVTLVLVLSPAMSLSSAATSQVTREASNIPPDLAGDRVVVTAMAPMPEVGSGAPRFTSEDIQDIQKDAAKTAFRSDRDLERCSTPKGYLPPVCGHRSLNGLLACERDAARKLDIVAQGAAKATTEAESLRRDSALGHTEQQSIEDAELRRQVAVAKMEEARGNLFEAQADVAVWQDLILRGRTQSIELDVMAAGLKRKQASRQGYRSSIGGLTIADVQAVLIEEVGTRVLRITGRVVNDANKSAMMPKLNAMTLDDRGWVLATQTVTAADQRQIPARGSQDFQFEVAPVARATHKAIVSLASKADPPPRLGMGVFCRP